MMIFVLTTIAVIVLVVFAICRFLGPAFQSRFCSSGEEKVGLSKDKLYNANGYIVSGLWTESEGISSWLLWNRFIRGLTFFLEALAASSDSIPLIGMRTKANSFMDKQRYRRHLGRPKQSRHNRCDQLHINFPHQSTLTKEVKSQPFTNKEVTREKWIRPLWNQFHGR